MANHWTTISENKKVDKFYKNLVEKLRITFLRSSPIFEHIYINWLELSVHYVAMDEKRIDSGMFYVPWKMDLANCFVLQKPYN